MVDLGSRPKASQLSSTLGIFVEERKEERRMDKSTAWQNKVTFFNLLMLKAEATKRKTRASFILNGEVRIRPIFCLKMESYEWCIENNRFQIG